jgi:hypothetical protein
MGLTATTSVVRAEPIVRPGARGFVVTNGDATGGGGMADVALGYDLELQPVIVMPELVGSFGGFGGDLKGFGARALGGMRFGFTYAGAWEPSLFARGGYGHASVSPGSGGSLVGFNGGTIQAGLTADYRVGRELTVGGELGYDALIGSTGAGSEVFHTVSAGIVFGFPIR